MNYHNLTDTEFRHYQELYNTDPIVQRLCKIDHDKLQELEDEIEELRNELESVQNDYEFSQEDLMDAQHENRLLREKIQIWSALEN